MRVFLALLALCLAPLAWAAEDPMLSVDALSGLVQVQRDGKQYGLHEGEALQARDVLITDGKGRVSLSFARHGFIEIGSNAQVAFEALPPSSYSSDLRTAFALSKGYLRVVWKRPQSATAWPINVSLGSTRAVLGSGEYFFQQGTEQRLCTAAGAMAVQFGATTETVRPPACAKLRKDGQMEIAARNPDDWITVRRAFSVRAGEPVIIETAAAPVAPAPVAPAAPRTMTSDMPAAKPGMDYSLLEGQPGIATSPETAVAAAKPVAAAPAPEPAATPEPVAPSAPNPYEVGKSTGREAVPQLDAVAAAKAEYSAPSVKGTWRINIASYTEAADAQPLLEKAEALGLPVRQTTANIHGRDWTRVQVGAYASAAEAERDAPRVKAALGLASVWFAQDK